MYAAATFHSRRLESRLVVPSAAIMRLQDRDWVFKREGAQRFRQIEIHSVNQTEDGLQEIQNGAVQAGQEIVINALEFAAAMAEQQK